MRRTMLMIPSAIGIALNARLLRRVDLRVDT